MKRLTTRIGTKTVPVVEGSALTVFSAGRKGAKEKGKYCFWSAVCLYKNAQKTITGRARIELDPGERFRRIGKERLSCADASDRKHYREHWKVLGGVLYVRPASAVEVSRWMISHEEDAAYLKSMHFA